MVHKVKYQEFGCVRAGTLLTCSVRGWKYTPYGSSRWDSLHSVGSDEPKTLDAEETFRGLSTFTVLGSHANISRIHSSSSAPSMNSSRLMMAVKWKIIPVMSYDGIR